MDTRDPRPQIFAWRPSRPRALRRNVRSEVVSACAARVAHHPQAARARANTWSSIGPVSRPVNVFCWLT